MKINRRRFLAASGGGLAALAFPFVGVAEEKVTVAMRGTSRGERIWFSPLGIAVAPGTVVRFINEDGVNSHTATTYHPQLDGRMRRIPEGAEPWDSGFLMPGEAFEVTLQVPGVYDYYCRPHERAGMVGRIVVGSAEHKVWAGPSESADDLPEVALATFPAVETILTNGPVMPKE